jgi:predicted pyridoxine 5'-phosphate oxidase superfamily flavin-nucleotide-binding protein
MTRAFAEISFTPSVIAIQESYGSADNYAGFLHPDTEAGNRLGPDEQAFITQMDGFFQATVSDAGWPYVQFRGGPKGFLKVLDEQTIAYADFRGNRQYISAGNLQDNERITLILMDYPNRRRLKIWGRAKLVISKSNPDLIEQLQDPNYRALPERAVVITVEALDWNCPQHIPQRMTLEELEPQLQPIRDEIAGLKAENEKLQVMLDQET